MKLLDPRRLLAGGLFALAFAGGVAAAPSLMNAAVAGTSNDLAAQALDHHGLGGADLLTAAANYIGITVADLRAELQAGKSLADVAVEKGKTRDGLIAALTQAESQRIAQLVDRKGLSPQGPGGRGFHVSSDPFAAAAAYLGISQQDLMTKVRSGQSLATIANSTTGKNRDGLINAIVADATAKIDAAQKANTITADQATQLKNGLKDRITKLVDATGPWAPFPGFHRGRP